ncbi:hypothetical protein ABPG77_006121 [Micractinium sp. CCAP 211/92]
MGSPQAAAGCSRRWSRSSRGFVKYVLAASARDSLQGPDSSGSGPASGSPQQDADAASPEAAAELEPKEHRYEGTGGVLLDVSHAEPHPYRGEGVSRREEAGGDAVWKQTGPRGDAHAPPVCPEEGRSEGPAPVEE